MIRSHFSKLLKAKEEKDGRVYTYRDITEATGLSNPTLVKWQYARVHLFEENTLNALCTFFHCSVSDLISFTPDVR